MSKPEFRAIIREMDAEIDLLYARGFGEDDHAAYRLLYYRNLIAANIGDAERAAPLDET